MISVRRIFILLAFLVPSLTTFGQGNFRFPSLNDARNGHLKAFKIPKLNDYKKFTKGYGKQLAMLDRRSEKAYRKSFLKFIDLEDDLLYTLCDSNEFRANALMRSAAASFGKMETDRNNKPEIPKSQKQKSLAAAVKLSEESIPALAVSTSGSAEEKHTANQKKFGSKFYAEYMKKRVSLYKTTFKEGTKEQKKMLRKLRKRAMLWQSYKEQDSKLIAGFADKHLGIMKSLEAKPEFASVMKPQMTDFSGTQLDPKMNMASFDQSKLLDMLQKKITADGLLTPEQLGEAKNVKELFAKLQEAKKETSDTTSVAQKKENKEKPLKIDSKASQRFWDRLYGGADFDWENSTGYYPDGLGITLNGGYHISDNSGLTLELQTVFNASKMGWANDKRFESTLVSNYAIGANIDYRIWKVFFAGIGSEVIINNIEAPAEELIDRLENSKYTFGVPLIFRVLLPISGANSTNIEFRYDLNSNNNIKPKFDFKVGFLIGR